MENNENTNEQHFLQILREAIDKQIENIENEKTIEDQTNNISFDTEDEYEMGKEAINDPSVVGFAAKSELNSKGEVVEDEGWANRIKEGLLEKELLKYEANKGQEVEELDTDLNFALRRNTIMENLNAKGGMITTLNLDQVSEEELYERVNSQGGI